MFAKRHDVAYELKYSQLVDILDGITDEEENSSNNDKSGVQMMISETLTIAIDNKIALKNEKRRANGEEDLADWYRKYALLQGELVWH